MSEKFKSGLLEMTDKWKNKGGSEDDSKISQKIKEKNEKNSFILGTSAKFQSVLANMMSKCEIKYTKVQLNITSDISL